MLTAKQKGDLNFSENPNPKIKSQELAKVKLSKFKKDDFDIEIIGDIKSIEVNGINGIELFAVAFKNGKPVGFGKDGSVEIERFRFFNPPVLVDDPNGDIIRKWKDKETGEIKQRKLREDKDEVIKQILEQAIKVVAKDGKDIIKGKIGNTTSTFYPDADAESTSVDGRIFRHAVNETFATIRAGAGTGATSADATNPAGEIGSSTTTDQYGQLIRAIFLFDTSALPDGDNIDSASYSFYCSSKSNALSGEGSVNSAIVLVASTPASNTDLVSGDYGQTGSTEFGRSGVQSGISTVAYTDITLNSSGLTDITKTGVSKFATRYGWDFDATTTGITWASNVLQGVYVYNADEAGTTKDPKLVVVHTATANTGFFQFM